jgi:hypothetical protein
MLINLFRSTFESKDNTRVEIEDVEEALNLAGRIAEDEAATNHLV